MVLERRRNMKKFPSEYLHALYDVHAELPLLPQDTLRLEAQSRIQPLLQHVCRVMSCHPPL